MMVSSSHSCLLCFFGPNIYKYMLHPTFLAEMLDVLYSTESLFSNGRAAFAEVCIWQNTSPSTRK